MLTAKRDWPHHTDRDTGNFFVHSPCGRVDVAFLGDYFDPWQIRVSAEPMDDPSWFASFHGNTPPEIVGAFLETLADTLEHLPDHLTSSRTHLVREATRALEQAGWTKEITSTHTAMKPPGEHAHLAGLTVQQHPYPSWMGEDFSPDAGTITMWGGPKGSGAHWTARFTTDTPLHLIAAATRSLTTNAPVPRHREDLDPAVLPYLTDPAARPSSRTDAARATGTASAAAGTRARIAAAPAPRTLAEAPGPRR
ncbi:DUF317 domain-containing protein [Streptacidiphilus sp. MAP5-52]|uniref:DUF317 domain-containing protein n=1 Tax=Streptacidiphilus sp. MAP5-52 TaxID=3156267 RepID=UPI0035134D8D